MVLSGNDILREFKRQHADGLKNAEMRRYILSRSWELAQLPPDALPDLEDTRFTADDPYGRVLDICEGHVADIVKAITAGKPLAPAIADDALVFLDGNHRAVAC